MTFILTSILILAITGGLTGVVVAVRNYAIQTKDYEFIAIISFCGALAFVIFGLPIISIGNYILEMI